MQQLNKTIYPKKEKTIKIMQFGEGNFLRAFVDWIIKKMNDSGVYDGHVVVVQPLNVGRVEDLKKQDGLYTLYLEGIDQGEIVKKHEVIDVLDDFINPYSEYDKFLSYASNPDLEIIVSNTTEAGIALDKDDTDFLQTPRSYPGKLLAFLLARYHHFKGDMTKGLMIVPCELIDDNGLQLKNVIVELATIKRIDPAFINWLIEANEFSSTLVDRIVPGYPKNDIKEIEQELGYSDVNLVKGEIFHLWVVEDNPRIHNVFPAEKAGLNVVFAKDIHPYKERKVKILNGSHTAMVPVAYLANIDYVGDVMKDPDFYPFVRKLIFDEIVPTINLPKEDMERFASSVLERYANPFVKHELMSIALNSTTKYKTRLLPTLLDYYHLKGELPRKVVFALASLMVFFKGKRGSHMINLQDDEKYLVMWKEAWDKVESKEYRVHDLVYEILGRTDLWEQDLNKIDKLTTLVTYYVEEILTIGTRRAVKKEFA
jgi:tagaturonate reductase